MGIRIEGIYPSICPDNEGGFCDAQKEDGKIPSEAVPVKWTPNRLACGQIDYVSFSKEDIFTIQARCDRCPNKSVEDAIRASGELVEIKI